MTTTQMIADSINKLMHAQGKRNKDLANLIGCTDTHAGNIRKGKSSLEIEDLYRVAKWLEVSTDDLARGYELTPRRLVA